MSRDSAASLMMFVVGTAVGAVAVALYTPVTGRELRRRLSRAAEDGAGMVDGALDQVDQFVQEKSKAASKLVHRAEEAFQKARDEAANVAP